MTKPRIGIALCGSYCTYDKLFSQLVLLSDKYELVPIMSETAAATDTRFGKAADFLSRLESLCGTKPVCSIAEAEPLGPAKPMEALIIAPCTGTPHRRVPGRWPVCGQCLHHHVHRRPRGGAV